MTTEHDEGFAAGIEAAAKKCEEIGWRKTADEIRNLKPAPRSAEHTAEPSAQDERERFKLLLHRFANVVKGPSVSGETSSAYIAVLVAYDAALATAPSPRIEAEPVGEVRDYWLGNVLTTWHTIELPPIGTKLYLAPPDRTPDARSTSDAAVVLPPAPYRDKANWEQCYDREDLEEYATVAVLADRATRSTDSSAEGVDGNALRDEFEQWYVENAFDFKRNPIGSGLCGQQWFAYAGAKGLSHAEANIVLLDRMARAEAAKLTSDNGVEHVAEAAWVDHETGEQRVTPRPPAHKRPPPHAKLTTAPHTADETRETK